MKKRGTDRKNLTKKRREKIQTTVWLIFRGRILPTNFAMRIDWSVALYHGPVPEVDSSLREVGSSRRRSSRFREFAGFALVCTIANSPLGVPVYQRNCKRLQFDYSQSSMFLLASEPQNISIRMKLRIVTSPWH